MTSEFRKPFTSPPTIFTISLIGAIGLGFLFPGSILPWSVQLVSGPILVFVGVYVIVRSIRDIESAGTTYDPYGITTELVTFGIYQYSRNPGYLGLAVIQLGVAVLFDNLWIVLAGFIAVFVTTRFVIRLEEDKLAAAFGERYIDYKKRVRRWI